MKHSPQRRIEQEIARIAATAKATVGVYAQQLGTGETIGFNAEQRFPMASVYKLPIALQMLRLVEGGEFDLADLIEVPSTDISPGSGLIKEQLLEPGVILSIGNLLGLMLRVSDNTASDILLRLGGGAEAVTAWLQSIQLPHIRVDRPLKQVLADFYGVTNLPAEWSMQAYRTGFHALSDEAKRAAQAEFLLDPRDTCTPQAIVTLLARVQRGALANPAHTDLLLSHLRTSPSSPGRIKGLLPPGLSVAHKGGTLGDRIINDVGLIRLPAEAGAVALGVFILTTGKAIPEQERVIAHLARSMYDYFLFTAG
jgi:beta-lactamase class A